MSTTVSLTVARIARESAAPRNSPATVPIAPITRPSARKLRKIVPPMPRGRAGSRSRPAPDHGHRDRVVDEERAHEQGNGSQRGEIEPVRPDHPIGGLAARGRPRDGQPRGEGRFDSPRPRRRVSGNVTSRRSTRPSRLKSRCAWRSPVTSTWPPEARAGPIGSRIPAMRTTHLRPLAKRGSRSPTDSRCRPAKESGASTASGSKRDRSPVPEPGEGRSRYRRTGSSAVMSTPRICTGSSLPSPHTANRSITGAKAPPASHSQSRRRAASSGTPSTPSTASRVRPEIASTACRNEPVTLRLARWIAAIAPTPIATPAIETTVRRGCRRAGRPINPEKIRLRRSSRRAGERSVRPGAQLRRSGSRAELSRPPRDAARDQAHDHPCRRVEVSRRLVGEQERRSVHEGRARATRCT